MKGDRRRRRRHTDEFKANLLRRWIEQSGQRLPSVAPVETAADILQDQAKSAFVLVQLDATPSPTASDSQPRQSVPAPALEPSLAL